MCLYLLLCRGNHSEDCFTLQSEKTSSWEISLKHTQWLFQDSQELLVRCFMNDSSLNTLHQQVTQRGKRFQQWWVRSVCYFLHFTSTSLYNVTVTTRCCLNLINVSTFGWLICAQRQWRKSPWNVERLTVWKSHLLCFATRDVEDARRHIGWRGNWECKVLRTFHMTNIARLTSHSCKVNRLMRVCVDYLFIDKRGHIHWESPLSV